MKRPKLPKTDSIEELAKFWDTHDVTEFEAQMEEVREPVFVRAKGTTLSIRLEPLEAQHLKEIAGSKGVNEATILRQWIVERLHECPWAGRPPGKLLPRATEKARHG
jgi:hypothetical protein